MKIIENIAIYAGIGITGFVLGVCHVNNKISKLELQNQIKVEKINNKTESKVIEYKTKVEYKTKYIKELIHDKESSNIDTNINGYWVFVHNSSAESNATNGAYESTNAVKVSKLMSVVSDNYASCNYDKERLRLLQEYIKELSK